MQPSVLAPPIRFGTVAFPLPVPETDSDSSTGPYSSRVTSFSECLYRGAYPKQRNLRFLETLHLRTIVSLTPKPIDDDPVLAQWAKTQNGEVGIAMVHIRTEKPKEETGGLTREGAARALMEVLNRENLPLYVHCLDGVEVTSTLIACLRKIQGWSDVAIEAELARGANSGSSRVKGALDIAPKHLTQFVGRFGEPDGVLMPQRDRIPGWLWPKTNLPLAPQDTWNEKPASVQHPSLKIHFERSESYIASQQARFGAVWSVFSHSRSRTPSTLSISGSSEGATDGHASSMRGSPSHSEVSSGHRHVDHTLLSHTRSSLLSQVVEQADMDASIDTPWSADTELDTRTPRAKPQYVDSDIPPLSSMDLHAPRPTRSANTDALERSISSLDERTPLVQAQDVRHDRALGESDADTAADIIPPLGLDGHVPVNHHIGAPAYDNIDDDDDYDEEEWEEDAYAHTSASLALEALDLDGY